MTRGMLRIWPSVSLWRKGGREECAAPGCMAGVMGHSLEMGLPEFQDWQQAPAQLDRWEDLCSSQELVPDSPEQGFHGAAGVGSRERSQQHTRLCAASPGAQLAPPARPGEQSPGSSDD